MDILAKGFPSSGKEYLANDRRKKFCFQLEKGSQD